MSLTYKDNEVFNKFVSDMESIGLDVQNYKGRFYYDGPAVIVGDIQEAIRATKLKLQWDNMAFDYVVYPEKYQTLPDDDDLDSEDLDNYCPDCEEHFDDCLCDEPGNDDDSDE